MTRIINRSRSATLILRLLFRGMIERRTQEIHRLYTTEKRKQQKLKELEDDKRWYGWRFDDLVELIREEMGEYPFGKP